MAKLLLLVDDDIDDQDLFLEALTVVDNEVECMIANDGLEALKLLEQLHQRLPNLVFLDLNMPRMDGLSFLKEIRSRETLRQLSIVVYSTSNQPKHKQDVTEMGAVGFIVKPDNFAGLTQAIKDALANWS